MRDNSKIVRYTLKSFALLETFRTGKELDATVLEGFPADAEIIHHKYDLLSKEYILFVWSDSFESVRMGDLAPWGEVKIAPRVVPPMPSALAIIHLHEKLGRPPVKPADGETHEMAIVRYALARLEKLYEEREGEFDRGYASAIHEVATGEKTA